MASEQRIQQITDGVVAHRFHRDCELALRERRDDGAVSTFRVNEYTANPFGVLHGGILYAMLDVSAFLAVVPQLADDEGAVSHDLHVSVLRAAIAGETVTLDATVLRRGRRIVFTRVDAFDEQNRQVAGSQVTKSVIAA